MRSFQAEVNWNDERLRQSFETLPEAKGWIETKQVELKNHSLAAIRNRKSILRGFLAFNGDTQLTNLYRPDIKAYIEHRSAQAAKTRKGDISNPPPF
jgi:hypothetical protein